MPKFRRGGCARWRLPTSEIAGFVSSRQICHSPPVKGAESLVEGEHQSRPALHSPSEGMPQTTRRLYPLTFGVHARVSFKITEKDEPAGSISTEVVEPAVYLIKYSCKFRPLRPGRHSAVEVHNSSWQGAGPPSSPLRFWSVNTRRRVPIFRKPATP